MSRVGATLWACVVFIGTPGSAGIIEWGSAPGGYIIDNDIKTIVVTAPGTYKFMSIDGAELDDINGITVQAGVSGVVTLYVAHEEGGDGARNVRLLNLSGDATTNVEELSISNNFGELGPMVATEGGTLNIGGDVLSAIDIEGAIGGPLTVGGLLLADLSCDKASDISLLGLGEHTGDITITGDGPYSDEMYFAGPMCGAITISQSASGRIKADSDVADIYTHAVSGEVRVAGDLTGDASFSETMTGSVLIEGDLLPGNRLEFGSVAGVVEVEGSTEGYVYIFGVLAEGATFTIGGELATLLAVGHDLSGDVTIGGDLTGSLIAYDWMSGSLTVVGNVDGSYIAFGDSPKFNDMAGTIAIGGNICGNSTIRMADLEGIIHVGGSVGGDVHITGDCVGDVLMDGALADGEADYEIEIDGVKAPDAIIAANHDGPNPDDDYWYGVVRIDGADYPDPVEARNLWEVTCYKGDMDNNGHVDAFDIDPFTEALADLPAYLAVYPGLAGSAVYRGDMNCDDALNAFDIDAFTLRLSDPDAYYALYDCEVCPGERLMGDGGCVGSEPADIAALFELHINAERLPFVIDAIHELVAHFDDTPRGEFWAAVLAELE